MAVLLAAQWSGDGEPEWFTRRVALALAGPTDLHVITLEGGAPSTTVEGGAKWPVPVGGSVTGTDARAADAAGSQRCTVHWLGTAIGVTDEARRTILLTALAATRLPGDGPCGPAEKRLIDRGALEPWTQAETLLKSLHPSTVIVADCSQTGAWSLARRAAPAARKVLLPLVGRQPAISLPYFDPLFDEAAAIVVATEAERRVVMDRSRTSPALSDRVHLVGVPWTRPEPLTVSPASDRANDRTSDSTDNVRIDVSSVEGPHVVVFTDSRIGSHDDRAGSARMVAQRLPQVATTVVGIDGIECWRQGYPTRVALGGHLLDAQELLARATETVDLRPGPLFARRTLDSLILGTPVVVPASSRGRQHAELGGGGLWFRSPGELLWCVEAVIDPQVAGRFGSQGRRYAHRSLASPADFEGRVRSALIVHENSEGAT